MGEKYFAKIHCIANNIVSQTGGVNDFVIHLFYIFIMKFCFSMKKR